jgi:SAM-dependent methyltransferase
MKDGDTFKKDEIARYNMERWDSLVKNNALFTRPKLTLDTQSAREYIDPKGNLGDVSGKSVLCLAGGGGQQSAAFALLGAHVTVLDISESQLARDREAAAHYGVYIETVHGDMRDLSCFQHNSFDIVWHPYSLNFVPDCRVVFGEVSEIIREGGLYHFMCANPFTWGVTERDWNGAGYPLIIPYADETELTYEDQDWVYDKKNATVNGPREYRQTLGRLMNGLIEQGFIITGFDEVKSDAPDPRPGSWGHFTNIARPWLKFWTSYQPGLLKRTLP